MRISVSAQTQAVAAAGLTSYRAIALIERWKVHQTQHRHAIKTERNQGREERNTQDKSARAINGIDNPDAPALQAA